MQLTSTARTRSILRWTTTVGACLALGLVAAGCGTSTNDSSSPAKMKPSSASMKKTTGDAMASTTSTDHAMAAKPSSGDAMHATTSTDAMKK